MLYTKIYTIRQILIVDSQMSVSHIYAFHQYVESAEYNYMYMLTVLVNDGNCLIWVTGLHQIGHLTW